jgi:4-amino-4-deoxy-L-arabinose transferase-like glycosyltransferase
MLNRIRAPIIVLLGCGLLVRLAVLLWYLTTHGWTPETWEYEVIALNLLDRHEFSYPYYGTVYRSYIAPVFAFICYFLHVIGGRGFVLYFVFHLSVALLTIWLTYRLASRWLNERTGMLAGLLVSLEPGLIIYNSYKVDVVTLASCLLLIGLALFEQTAMRDGMRPAVLLGLLSGVSILTRMDLVAVLAPFLVWIALPPRPWRTIMPRLMVVVGLVAVTILPWLVRNYLVHGRAVFVTTTAWEHLWIGIYEATTGTPVPFNGGSRINFASPSLKATVATGTELEQYAAFRDEALRLITADPAGFVLRASKKFIYFWWFTPTYGMFYINIPAWMRQGYKALYALLLILALVGGTAAMARADGRLLFLMLSVLSVIFTVVLLHSIYYVEGRHRVLVMPLVLMFSAAGLDRFLSITAIKSKNSLTALDLPSSPSS